MEASELRCKNFATIDNPEFWPKLKDIPLRVYGINLVLDLCNEWSYSISLEHIDRKPNTYYDTYSQFIKYVKPIPLTEEWLIKFGLIERYVKNEWSWVKCKEVGEWESWTEIYKLYDNFWFTPSKVPIKYVHQLQNLYYVLTGEELTVKQK